MKYPSLFKNRTAQSLALVTTLSMGIAGLACAHADTPEQDAAVQRPVPPDRGNGNKDGSTSREDAIRGKNPVQGSSAERDSGTIDRSSQGMGADRDGRPMNRPDRSDDHGDGH